MKKLFQVCIIACAAFSTNSFAEPSYACTTMLERGSEMFCAKGSETLALASAKEAAPVVAKKGGSFACNTMLERGSEMFCNKNGGLPGTEIASE